MKQHFLYLFLLLAFTGCKNDQKKLPNTTETATYATIYLIRHAEKDRSDPGNPDPQLTAQGRDRALHWAEYFKDIPIDVIYSTNYVRTKMTVVPLAKSKGLPVVHYEPGKLYSPRWLRNMLGKHALISGHSNTTPELVNRIIQEDRYPQMDDSDNSSLFIIKTDGVDHQVSVETVNL
jgi:phosphohistidine phosphatase SixA